MSTNYTTTVLAEVLAERGRQDRKWGEQNHPSVDYNIVDSVQEFYPAGPWGPRFRVTRALGIPTADSARIRVGQRSLSNTPEFPLTWSHILVEGLCEAVEAAVDSEDGAELRAELVQVAAVAVAWIENIDRRQGSDYDRHDRLYTPAEVGDAQASEAELVSEPLRRKLRLFEGERRTYEAGPRPVTAVDTRHDHLKVVK